MDEIMIKIYDYNSIIFDINNSSDWNELKIPHALMNKRSKCEYQIFHSIIEYCLTYKKLEKPINIIIDNIHNNFFKIDDQLINANSFKTYISYLLK
jgi:hypothetical protein